MKKNNHKQPAAQQLRIIGGEWRGRKLSFTPEEGLRPTLDRFRETLFNWLMFDVEGSTCLDLFAGSGALGLEALSRGASKVDFIELSQHAAKQIQQHLNTLNCNRGRVHCSNGLNWLKQHKGSFDLVFLDPPFHKGLLEEVLEMLLQGSYINLNGYIYIEAEASFNLPQLPSNWSIHREKSVKNKAFFLLQKTSEN